MEEKVVMCIDVKSFYASVECVDRGLDPFSIPLVVADKSRGKGTIVLAVSPCLRELGVPSRCRVYELPNMDNIVFAKPRMQRYLKVSADIVATYLDYVAEDDIHVYSVDESFLDFTHYMKMYNKDPLEIAKDIIKRIKKDFGLTVNVGIGPNLLIAKLAMDIEGKHASSQVAKWTKEDIKTKLYPLTPLSKMWGIGHAMEKRLNSLGFYKVGDIARAPKSYFKKMFGVMGEQLHDNCNGIDNSDIRKKIVPGEPSLSLGQVLMRDYKKEEIPILLREMSDDLALRLKLSNLFGKTVSLYIGYSKQVNKSFSHQVQLDTYSNNEDDINEALNYIFSKYATNDYIRRVGISITNLKSDKYFQPNLFSDPIEQEKERNLKFVIAQIKSKYGNNAILRTDALTKSSTAINRHKLIGGHAK